MIILDNVGVSLSTSNQQPVNGDPGKKINLSQNQNMKKKFGTLML